LASALANELGKIATVGLAPAIFGPVMNITGSVLATFWRNKPLPVENIKAQEKDMLKTASDKAPMEG
jgi:BASS family bile acid:Na+ symporter